MINSIQGRSLVLRLCALLCVLNLSSLASAQEVPEIPQVVSPLYSEKDPNGVDVQSGKRVMEMPVVLSVPAAPRLTFDRMQNAAPYVVGNISAGDPDQFNSASWTVHSGASKSDAFKCYYSTDCSPVTSGSTFRQVGRFYREEGTGAVYTFDKLHLDTGPLTSGRTKLFYASKITYPDGEIITFTYDQSGPFAGDPFSRVYYRPVQISSNTGYHLTIAYNFSGTDPETSDWTAPSEVVIYKTSAPSTPLARATYTFPYSANPYQTTDFGSGTTGGRVFTGGGSNMMGSSTQVLEGSLQLPTESTPTLTVQRSTPVAGVSFGTIGTINRDGVNWSYAYGNPRDHVYCTRGLEDKKAPRWDSVNVTGPNGYQVTYTLTGAGSCEDGFHNVLQSSTDALGRVTNYNFGLLDGKLYSVTYPEGNSVSLGYTACGGISGKTMTPKPGSGQTALSETLTYPADGTEDDPCPTVLSYRPTSHVDAMSRTTNYTYDNLGQITQELAPADANGVRRQTNITYTVNAGGISRKTLVRVCGGSSCTGHAESRTEYTYFGNSNLPLTVTQKDEATGQTRVTIYSYDNAGRVMSVDGPLTGTDDAKYVRYDQFGRKTWEIGEAAPNGIRLAKRFTYRVSDNKVTLVESGTLPNATSSTLTIEEQTASSYDSRRNPIRELTSSGGATYRVTDRSFLDRGLADCSTVRMNLGALPAASATGACGLGTAGTQDADRIAKNLYDSVGQLTTVQKAFATPLQQNYAAYTYSLNGKQLSVTDANGNKAGYTYDGFDRLTKWAFPDKDTKGLVSPTDYELYGYDGAGNRISLRKRDGRTLAYAYDALNRMSSKIVPADCVAGYACTVPPASAVRNVYYGYDLLGRQLSARFDSAATSSDGITNSYSGFGDILTSQLKMGSFSKTLYSTYDGVGRRTLLKHPENSDTYSFTYAYDAMSRLTGVYQGNGTNSPLDTFTYNNDGTLDRRKEGSGTNGVARADYSWDAIGRLTGQTDVLADLFPSASVAWSFTINPASQLVSESRDNDAYAYGGLVNVNRPYAVNGLNQYSTAGPASFTYDANGNLTADGTNVYTYDVENRLVKAVAGSVTTNLVYDPLGRLQETDQGTTGTTTKFLYDGDALALEYSSTNTVTNRFVHGSNTAADDPLVWYSGSNLNTKRYLHADHLGSVVAVTNNSGTSFTKNAYDEYGIPGSGNIGRFQYTGQAWIDELGMYYYKARIYSPTLGRFLQTDPIGYKDQVNLYAYVANDPINFVDFDGQEYGSYGTNGEYFFPGSRPASEGRYETIGEATKGLLQYSVLVTGAVIAAPEAGAFLASRGFTAFAGSASTEAKAIASGLRTQISHQFNRDKVSGLARAIQRERVKGELVGGKSHLQKGREAVRWADKQTQKIAKNSDLSKVEKDSLTRTVRSFQKEIQNALGSGQ